MTLQRPQSSPSHISRKPVKELGNFVPAAELFAQSRNLKRPGTAADPNRAPERPSGSPRSKRLQPKRAMSPIKTPVPPRSGASSRSDTVQMGPGLFMTKSQDRISVTLKTDFADTESLPARKTPIESLKDKVKELEEEIADLQNKVEDLTVLLEEERVAHRVTRKTAADELHFQLQQIKESHMDALRDLKRELSYQLDDQKRRSQYQMEKTEQEFQNALDQKQTEIDMIETAFETYKQNIAAEVADKMFKLETKLKQEALDDKTNALKEQKERMQLEHVNEIEKLHAKYQMEFKLMVQEKEREKDELLKNFTEATQDLAKFRSALEELDSLKSQYDNAKLEIRALQKETKNKSAEIRDLKFQIADFEANFAKKVEQVEEKFWLRAEGMMSENTELKRRYNEKCNQLFEARALQSSSIRDKSVSAAETMATLVGARVKAGVQVNVSNLSLDGVTREEYSRPLSAPLTSREEEHAQLCAGVHPTRLEYLEDFFDSGLETAVSMDKLLFMGDTTGVEFTRRPKTARSASLKRATSKSPARPKSSFAQF